MGQGNKYVKPVFVEGEHNTDTQTLPHFGVPMTPQTMPYRHDTQYWMENPIVASGPASTDYFHGNVMPARWSPHNPLLRLGGAKRQPGGKMPKSPSRAPKRRSPRQNKKA